NLKLDFDPVRPTAGVGHPTFVVEVNRLKLRGAFLAIDDHEIVMAEPGFAVGGRILREILANQQPYLAGVAGRRISSTLAGSATPFSRPSPDAAVAVTEQRITASQRILPIVIGCASQFKPGFVAL